MTKQIGSCFSCSIGIGKDFIEPQLYRVGDVEICGWCKKALEKRGSLKIVEEECKGKQVKVVHLFQDGRTEVTRYDRHSNPSWDSR